MILFMREEEPTSVVETRMHYGNLPRCPNHSDLTPVIAIDLRGS